MSWRERSPMQQRLQLVQEYLSGLWSMTALVAQYGVSRKTAYKWVGRYDPDDAAFAGLCDQSRRPHAHPRTTDAAIVQALLQLRKRHPNYGAKKLLWLAEKQDPAQAWPSRSTVHAWLQRAGMIEPRHRRRSAPRLVSTLAPITAPNGTWTVDFKGQFLTGDGQYCYPLTLRDGWSRFVLRCDALLGQTLADTRRRFERAFAAYGLPDRIRSDNGEPFAGVGLARLSRLAVWWMRLGIVVERIALGRPDQNGSHEHFHSVLKRHTARPPAQNLGAQQRRFDRFRHEYNGHRPHEALDGATPAAHYTPSSRVVPSRPPVLEYPGHMEVRRIAPNGTLSWRGVDVFVTETLGGERVALEEVGDGLWTMYFVSTPLARFDERRRTFQDLAVVSKGAPGD